MSAHVTVHESAEELRVEVHQRLGEVVRLGVLVVVVCAALYALVPAARSSPGPLVGIVALAVAWGAFALSARELYVIDRKGGTMLHIRTSVLGRRLETVSIQDIGEIRFAIGGGDDDRRLVEVIDRSGKVRLRVPRRLTTLSAWDQEGLGRSFAMYLDVPLRGEPDRRA